KTHVYRIIRSGEVRINKARAAADTRIAPGDVLRLPPLRRPSLQSRRAQSQTGAGDAVPVAGSPQVAQPRRFPVLYESEALLALDKPAGVAVHGGSGVSFGVIEQLRAARPAATRLELVHRLDRETSGVLLVAKKRSALTALQAQFRQRETGKTYLALVEGRWPAERKVLDAPLAKYLQGDGERRVRVVDSSHADAMTATTLVRVVSPIELPAVGFDPSFSLLAVTIKTGRTHQIRVHLASSGHCIAGDDKYGNFERNRALHKCGLKRMFLHAWRLRFVDPASGEPVLLQAELPPDLSSLLAPSALAVLATWP
ncbi:MAG: RluA family pseudouridine synthase, partial [Variovorax sp.]